MNYNSKRATTIVRQKEGKGFIKWIHRDIQRQLLSEKQVETPRSQDDIQETALARSKDISGHTGHRPYSRQQIVNNTSGISASC